MRILDGEGVRKNFGGLAAVAGVDFCINQGEIVGLIGPNGAGKTTIFNLISGALNPSSGQIRFNGESITGLKPYQICKRGVARTFQSAKLFADMTVINNVLVWSLFGKSARTPVADAEMEAREALAFVGLSEKEELPAKDLGIAAQKRLEIARALATKPQVILLDEVMAGLNPTEVTQAIELIKQIWNKGISVFMIEHVMKAVMGMADRVIVLHHGEKLAEGTPEAIAKNRKVVEVYLGE
ncbi:MAG: ABC transporter ATP-binding protein [Deltaproteobacteria bacterium]|nr:ABC transporter ATP-binding protein [Deltaproteobacteria bacterium]